MNISKTLKNAKTTLSGVWQMAAAGAAGAVLVAGNALRAAKDKAGDVADRFSGKQKGEVRMKKSTLVALLVALAAVAGVLGALYVYVIRRERELDEYEQLLFSEDFDDDLPEEYDDEPLEQAPAKPKKK